MGLLKYNFSVLDVVKINLLYEIRFSRGMLNYYVKIRAMKLSSQLRQRLVGPINRVNQLGKKNCGTQEPKTANFIKLREK